ncbi:hypothetical protein AGLY_005962 [Aphis glycines]|uniref:Uncharacterized protein n=1 Tax=Aphis glycines TaxID=307491 RepID=A0A6G0TTB0_APHGL|nr:hypothetical protein AGLY_005962 [Aphis glycines]
MQSNYKKYFFMFIHVIKNFSRKITASLRPFFFPSAPISTSSLTHISTDSSASANFRFCSSSWSSSLILSSKAFGQKSPSKWMTMKYVIIAFRWRACPYVSHGNSPIISPLSTKRLRIPGFTSTILSELDTTRIATSPAPASFFLRKLFTLVSIIEFIIFSFFTTLLQTVITNISLWINILIVEHTYLMEFSSTMRSSPNVTASPVHSCFPKQQSTCGLNVYLRPQQLFVIMPSIFKHQPNIINITPRVSCLNGSDSGSCLYNFSRVGINACLSSSGLNIHFFIAVLLSDVVGSNGLMSVEMFGLGLIGSSLILTSILFKFEALSSRSCLISVFTDTEGVSEFILPFPYAPFPSLLSSYSSFTSPLLSLGESSCAKAEAIAFI